MKTFTRRTFARLLGASATLAGGSGVWPKFALADVTHGYELLAANNGISVIHATAIGIDGVKKAVVLSDGTRVPYDRLIAAAGIGFKYDLIDGYDEKTAERYPHAYLADAQISILKRQLEAMEDGGVFAISSPP